MADEIKCNVYKTILNVKIGDSIQMFDRATNALGALFLRFDSITEQEVKLKRIRDLVTALIDEPKN